MYSYRYPVQELLMESNVKCADSLPGHSAGTAAAANAASGMQLSQVVKVNKSREQQAASGVGPSAPVSSIDHIDHLLEKVEQLSRTIPTAAERVKGFTIFESVVSAPTGDILEVQSKREASLLESLRGAISLLRSGFVDFRLNQDSVCKPFETEPSHVQKSNEEEGVAAAPTMGVNNAGVDVGQSAAQDEVI